LLSFHCSTTNTECGTDSCTADNLFNIACFIKCPAGHLGLAMCKKTLSETVEPTIATQRCKLTLPIPITGGSILDVQLTFCSFGQFYSGKRCIWYFVLPKEWYSEIFLLGPLVIKIRELYNLPTFRIDHFRDRETWTVVLEVFCYCCQTIVKMVK
jgi:hypothetical protein